MQPVIQGARFDIGRTISNLLLLFLVQKSLHYVFIDPRCCAQGKTDTKWDSESCKVDKGKGFGTKLFLVLRIGKVRPVAGDLLVAHNTDGNLWSKNQEQ